MAISAKLRAKTATLPGGGFPMPDANHARMALADLPASKASPAQKAKVKARAKGMLGAGEPDADDKPKPTPFKKKMG